MALRPRVTAAGLLVVCGLWAGCTCTSDDLRYLQFTCSTDADCANGHVCSNGVCGPQDSGAADSGTPDAGTPDAGSDAGTGDAGDADAGGDGGADAGSDGGTDAGSDGGSCSCTNLVSAYRFADTLVLGRDSIGANHMQTLYGTPQQSTVTPPGFSGYSLQLDGTSSVCTSGSYTFDSTANHTLCWWSLAGALSDSTNQFAQTCGYDTWTTNTGTAYRWRINNCNGGVAANLDVPGVYAVGRWVQICQTYQRAALKRTVVLDGQTDAGISIVDASPIVMAAAEWCIGSYGGGGFWTGLIYRPLWFDRALTDAEIQQVSARGCCLP